MQRSNDNQNQSIEEMKRTTALLGQRVNQLERLLDQKSINEAKVESGTVYQRESRLSLSNGMMRPNWQTTSVAGSGATVMDYSDFAFGFSISGAVVTVTCGTLRHGIRTPILVGPTDITIVADNTYIFCTYVFGSGYAVNTWSTAEPLTTEERLNYPLHLWGVTDGEVGIKRILHLGDIIIPGTFA